MGICLNSESGLPSAPRREAIFGVVFMRLIVQCDQCRLRYDATGRRVGGKFRCRCGQVVSIKRARGHEADVVHCAACGGAREQGEKSCSYCGADFTIHETDLDTICPGCQARVSDRARYCHHCASPLAADVVALARCGNVARLTQVLDEEPGLVRSTRDGKTLFYFMPADEERAVEVAELLLARGADPRVADAEGVTAADAAEKSGLEELAELLREAASAA